MNGTATWILGTLVALGGLLALFLASRATDQAFYLFGLVAFGAAVVYDAALLRRYFDDRDAVNGRVRRRAG
ncbi:MAG TPA: hypothetical protein VK943_08660 [Arenibaculum sp.]|nr:hypothetical protein [Arenibaculum sp.]